MNKISLCMIVKNEEKVLARCLNSIKELVDEIIVVDTGSNDATKEIASKFTNKIYDFKWCDDFSLARNYAFSHAKYEYVMWLDADDIVPVSTLKFLLELKKNMIKDVYMVKYDIAFSGDKPTFSYFRERIIRNCDRCKFIGVVHECIVPFGKIERLDVSIQHRKINIGKSDRNIKIYKKLIKERELTPREMYYYARELFDHGKYRQCIRQMEKFIANGNAWVENVIDGYFIKAQAHFNLSEDLKGVESLLKTFIYDEPRANVCCLLGDYFIGLKNWEQAIYWYNNAVNSKDVINKGGFVESKYYNYYPYLQLCVCYYNINDIESAKRFNALAGVYYESEAVISNRNFFNKLNI